MYKLSKYFLLTYFRFVTFSLIFYYTGLFESLHIKLLKDCKFMECGNVLQDSINNGDSLLMILEYSNYSINTDLEENKV